ncbi:MAG: leucine-rich repeat domain-containing protein [Muribaculaceae bacterium]|nr:leucine-rich repeat domain-containing protein [Muribaculaceae bacterium]
MRDGFFSEGAVTDILILPETVTSIGSYNTPGPFCGCYLPEVILPESLRFIGKYAFSSSYIEKLVVRASTESPYLRQFKDSTIRKVYLPNGQHSENTEGGGKYGFYANFHNHCKCEIINY